MAAAQLEAIQILTSSEEANGPDRTKKVLHTIQQYQNGPLLQHIFLHEDFKNLPILIYSITGKTRGGKSFLLNLMIKYLESQGDQGWINGRIENVFEWKFGTNSITRGLWICPKIYKRTNSLGKDVGIVLLDNQGLFDGEQSDGESIAISGISTAISHLQIFNASHLITSDVLENIWRHLMSDMQNMTDYESSGGSIMFVVRDFLGAEDQGCGLQNGRTYMEAEQNRGTEEHRSKWQHLRETFDMVDCMLLPHPGPMINKKSFKENRTLKDLDDEFVLEVDRFFTWLFSPKNLVPHKERLTGHEIYNILSKIDGKVADESLSFFNMFTEQGNQSKLENLTAYFQTKLDNLGENLSTAHNLMKEVSDSGRTKFKGKSANELMCQMSKNMESAIDCKIEIYRIKILNEYRFALRDHGIANNHKMVWPTMQKRLDCLVFGTKKAEIINNITKEAAGIYYEKLGTEMVNEFRDSWSMTATLANSFGFDDKFVTNKFQESFYDQNIPIKDLHPIWLKEQRQLKQQIKPILQQRVNKLQKDKERKEKLEEETRKVAELQREAQRAKEMQQQEARRLAILQERETKYWQTQQEETRKFNTLQEEARKTAREQQDAEAQKFAKLQEEARKATQLQQLEEAQKFDVLQREARRKFQQETMNYHSIKRAGQTVKAKIILKLNKEERDFTAAEVISSHL